MLLLRRSSQSTWEGGVGGGGTIAREAGHDDRSDAQGHSLSIEE